MRSRASTKPTFIPSLLEITSVFLDTNKPQKASLDELLKCRGTLAGSATLTTEQSAMHKVDIV